MFFKSNPFIIKDCRDFFRAAQNNLLKILKLTVIFAQGINDFVGDFLLLFGFKNKIKENLIQISGENWLDL